MANQQRFSPSLETRINIAGVLNELCTEKEYTRISVTEICERANVNRSTFYHHFENKESILQWHSTFAYDMGIDKIGRSYTWYQGHLITTRILTRYEKAHKGAGYESGYNSIQQFFERHRIATLKETLTEWKHEELTQELEFQILATAKLENSLGRMRMSGDFSVGIEDYCRLLCSTIPRELYDILNEPAMPDDDSDLLFLLNNGL